MNFYFFLVEPGPPEHAFYEHGLLSVAEGLRELGYGVYGNRDYWDVGAGPVVAKTGESPEDFDAVLISHEWLLKEGRLPREFASVRRPRRIYVDQSDGWTTPACSDRDWPAELVLRSHFNRHFRYQTRVKPWAFGLTHRIIESTAGGLDALNRDPVALCNFRVGHPVRDRLTTRFRRSYSDRFQWDQVVDTTPPSDPMDHSLWAATGRRHNPAYFHRLRTAQVCLAFGGFFAPGFRTAQGSLPGRMAYHVVQRAGLVTETLTQFDSWRFWESLAAGCLTVHGPLDAWGARFPVQPEAGVHYWAFNGGRSIEGGFEGRAWALEHYSPAAVARRLLEWL
jgi:hypothetical protein